MKTVIGLMVMVMLVSGVAAQHTTTSLQVARSPEVVLKEFYTLYIHTEFHATAFKGSFKGERVTLKKYVTARFIREIEKNDKLPPESDYFDADYFLQTQDPLPGSDNGYKESDWLKRMSISNVSVKGSTATAIVTFLGGYPKVKVTLLKEGGVWKIDKVKDARE